MRTGTTLIVAAIALAAGGFAGYRLALNKPEAAMAPVAVDGQKGAIFNWPESPLAGQLAALLPGDS